VQLNGCEAAFGLGFVMITFRGKPLQIFFTSLTRMAGQECDLSPFGQLSQSKKRTL
jgi:hypothetical protein